MLSAARLRSEVGFSMNKLNGSNSAYTFLSYLDEGEDTLKYKRKHRFSTHEISPRQKYVFSSAFPNLARFLSRPVTNFRPFLSNKKQFLRNCAFGTNKLRSKRETLCTLFSHTVLPPSPPARKDRARDPIFRFAPTLCINTSCAKTHRHPSTPAPSNEQPLLDQSIEEGLL